MANNTGNGSVAKPRKGTILTADQVNQIIETLIRRIEGGKGINIRSFNGRILIEESDA